MDFKEYADLKFEAAVSENRAIAAEIRSELNELDALVRSRPSLGWLIATSLAVIGTIIALFSFGGSQFAGGYAASSAYAKQLEDYRTEMMAQVEVTNAKIERNTEQLESIEALLIEAIENKPEDIQPDAEERTD